ncbi:MAG TPA: lmo0937 family membrane protein [Pyrinomonadaceae bacterium]|nr:lmo0937 family membrane protein [Pyrinomonadaceae bacterium]
MDYFRQAGTAIAIQGVQLTETFSGKRTFEQKGDGAMLWTILVILLVLWLVGLIGHIGGGLIHLLLVVALIVFVINLLTGRRTV